MVRPTNAEHQEAERIDGVMGTRLWYLCLF